MPGFPNFFTVLGPYGYNGSSYFNLIENQTRHIVRVLETRSPRARDAGRGPPRGQRPLLRARCSPGAASDRLAGQLLGRQQLLLRQARRRSVPALADARDGCGVAPASTWTTTASSRSRRAGWPHEPGEDQRLAGGDHRRGERHRPGDGASLRAPGRRRWCASTSTARPRRATARQCGAERRRGGCATSAMPPPCTSSPTSIESELGSGRRARQQRRRRDRRAVSRSDAVEDWDWLIGINLNGVAYGCRAFGKRMVERGRGHVVNVASGAAYVMSRDMAPTAPSKAAVFALLACLRADWALTAWG